MYGIWLPVANENYNQGPQAILIDAATEKVAWIATMTKTCTLDRLGYNLHTVSTGDTLKCSFQNVDMTTGFPDGTIDQYRTVVIGAGDGGKWIDPSTSPALGVLTDDGTDTGVKRSVTVGDIVAGVCEFDSFVAGSIQFRLLETNSNGPQFFGNTYSAAYVGAPSWSKPIWIPMVAFGCSDNTWQYIPGTTPTTNVDQTLAFNVDTGAQDEVALRFKLPYTAKLGQIAIRMNLSANADVVLYDGGSNPSFTLDSDLTKSTNNTPHVAQFNDVILAADTVYRAALKPTTASNVTIFYQNFQQNALLAASGGTVEMYWSSRVDGGAWTDLNTRRPTISLGLTAFDAGGGGAGNSGYISKLFGPYRPAYWINGLPNPSGVGGGAPAGGSAGNSGFIVARTQPRPQVVIQ
jgi:hypothetical protein